MLEKFNKEAINKYKGRDKFPNYTKISISFEIINDLNDP
jgi:hypothetical protein